MSSLIHLFYASAGTVEFDDTMLAALLKKARQTNSGLGVTGMLLYTNGDFLQVLEGEEAIVERLYARIVADKRHSRVTKIVREPIARRSFAEWTMGFARATTGELAEIDGLNDFFSRAACFRDLDDGRAKKLLAAFAEGRWRTRVAVGARRPPTADRRYVIADS